MSDTAGISPDLLRALVIILRRAVKDARKCVDSIPRYTNSVAEGGASNDLLDTGVQSMEVQLMQSGSNLLDIVFIIEAALTTILAHVQHFLLSKHALKRTILQSIIDEVLREMKPLSPIIKLSNGIIDKSSADYISTITMRLEGFRVQANRDILGL